MVPVARATADHLPTPTTSYKEPTCTRPLAASPPPPCWPPPCCWPPAAATSVPPGGGGPATTAAPAGSATTAGGITARSPAEIARAADGAFRSARSVRARVQGVAAKGAGPLDLTLTANGAQGWVTQPGGVRVDIVATDGSVYLRGRGFWARQGGAALAAAFGDHWVLLDPAKAGKVTPFASYFTIGGFADAFLGLLRAAGAFNSTSTATVAGQPAVRLRSTAGLCDVAATGKPYPLRLELPGGRVELSQYDRPVAIRAPRGALKAS